MQDKVSEYSYDDEKIISNLATYKKHIELMMAKIKMQHVVHDYIEYGVSIADIYMTLVQ